MRLFHAFCAAALLAVPWAVSAVPSNLYEFTVPSISGKPVSLSMYKGKVALVVNTASRCGFTPQDEGLENIYKKYASQDFVVLGFPCNDFGGQEPGSSEEIHTFCTSKFHVTFPMFEKVKVKAGDDQSPLYRYLGAKGDLPSWNFGKYLIDRQGNRVAFFGSSVKPESTELTQAIEAALKKK